jgi:alkanesulfonate monooxygenase SsuD/methylene tetrahydromethanopterin reductase-like flavin-dependent oxidoreductase (luciferase family)
MAARLEFGWRIPDFPEDRPADPRARAAIFRDQIFNFMDVIHGHFDTTWAGDHFFPWPAEVDQAMETHEPLSILTYLMGRYPHMRFGPSVLSQSYRPPALLAKMAAVLQWLSAGRLILGIGAGWKENEYRAYGYDYPPDRVRLDQLEEAVQIIRLMWSQDHPTFQGKYYHIDGAFCSPRPDPAPPLLIGGSGPKRTLRIVAQYADWCNVNNVDLAASRNTLDTLRGHCLAIGRDYETIVKTYSCECVALAASRAAAERIRDTNFMGQGMSMAGTPDDLAAQIQSFADLGFRHFLLRFADYPKTDGVQLFIQEVLPHFR